MKGLSIRAPWWWFILDAGKDIENRTWHCWYRGPLLIHASKWWDVDEVVDTFTDVAQEFGLSGRDLPFVSLKAMRDLGGHVVGSARVVACVTASSSRWFAGPYGMLLGHQVPLAAPFAYKGQLGFFEVPTPAS